MFYKQEIGQNGENLAEDYLKNEGYKIIKRNFRCKQGEIDIIAIDNNELVFIEVKTRSTAKYGNPAEAVNTIKQKHLKNAAEFYVHIHNLYKRFIRFDVIEIYYNRAGYKINHIKQAMDYQESIDF